MKDPGEESDRYAPPYPWVWNENSSDRIACNYQLKVQILGNSPAYLSNYRKGNIKETNSSSSESDFETPPSPSHTKIPSSALDRLHIIRNFKQSYSSDWYIITDSDYISISIKNSRYSIKILLKLIANRNI